MILGSREFRPQCHSHKAAKQRARVPGERRPSAFANILLLTPSRIPYRLSQVCCRRVTDRNAAPEKLKDRAGGSQGSPGIGRPLARSAVGLVPTSQSSAVPMPAYG
jgi:hypothetical protein